MAEKITLAHVGQRAAVTGQLYIDGAPDGQPVTVNGRVSMVAAYDTAYTGAPKTWHTVMVHTDSDSYVSVDVDPEAECMEPLVARPDGLELSDVDPEHPGNDSSR